MNRVLCFLHAGCNCNQSRHLKWLERMNRAVEQVETAANLEEGFEFFVPSLWQLVEDGKEQHVHFCFWKDSDPIGDIENLPSIAAGLIREYANDLLAAAERIDASGEEVYDA